MDLVLEAGLEFDIMGPELAILVGLLLDDKAILEVGRLRLALELELDFGTELKVATGITLELDLETKALEPEIVALKLACCV